MKYSLKSLPLVILTAILSITMVNCQNDSYLQDGGVHNPYYNGTVMDYLEKFPDPNYFTDLITVIKYAGLDSVLRNDSVTFFAPTDWSIRTSINALSRRLYMYSGQDSIKDLRQVRPSVWRDFLSMYIIPGKFRLKDIPQLDTANVKAYPGQAYYSYGGRPMNMGVVYYDVNGVKYAGSRQILFSYVNDFTTMDMINAYVATSDIQPVNGVLHVINFTKHAFGFRAATFVQKAMDNGIIPLDSLKTETENKITATSKRKE